jgi:hypothetical protein
MSAARRGGIFPPHFEPLLRIVREYHRCRDLSSTSLDIGGGNVPETEAHSELEMAGILPKAFAAGDSVRCCRRGRWYRDGLPLKGIRRDCCGVTSGTSLARLRQCQICGQCERQANRCRTVILKPVRSRPPRILAPHKQLSIHQSRAVNQRMCVHARSTAGGDPAVSQRWPGSVVRQPRRQIISAPRLASARALRRPLNRAPRSGRALWPMAAWGPQSWRSSWGACRSTRPRP